MFYQYGKDGLFAVTRPINSNLMFSFDEFEDAQNIFTNSIKNIKDIKKEPEKKFIK